MKLNKFIIILAISFSLMLCLYFSSSNIFATNNYDFENFTEEDSINFVLEHNIEIPKIMSNWDGLGEFTKNIILQSYYYPNYQFQFDYYESQKYAEDIRMAVALYIVPTPPSVELTRYIYRALQDNTVMDENGNWVTSGGYYNPDWEYYNCYAYAINRCEMSNFYSSNWNYQIGDMSGFETSAHGNIDTWYWTEIVKKDLIAMGYSNILISDTIPDVDDSQQLICLRGDNSAYHFMRYDIETYAWYHKPGKSAVLKYNYIPSSDKVWWREESKNGEEYYWDGQAYERDVVFIRYSKNIINTTPNTSQNIYIIPNKDVFYEVNIEQADHYRLKLIAGYEMDYELYDSNFDMVVSDSGNNNVDTCLSLTPGKYYLRINFTSSQSYSGLSASLCIDYSNDNNINNDSHTYICNGCGYSKVEAHTFECDGFENGVHYEKCVDCDYRNSQCTKAIFSSLDANNHSTVCFDCGYIVSEEPHRWIYTSISALYHEGHCADCGEIKTTQQSHSWKVASNPKYVECQYCGHLKLKPTGGGGGIIPVQPFKEDEIEEETE